MYNPATEFGAAPVGAAPVGAAPVGGMSAAAVSAVATGVGRTSTGPMAANRALRNTYMSLVAILAASAVLAEVAMAQQLPQLGLLFLLAGYLSLLVAAARSLGSRQGESAGPGRGHSVESSPAVALIDYPASPVGTIIHPACVEPRAGSEFTAAGAVRHSRIGTRR